MVITAIVGHRSGAREGKEVRVVVALRIRRRGGGGGGGGGSLVGQGREERQPSGHQRKR